jgi:hypothetical protein
MISDNVLPKKSTDSAIKLVWIVPLAMAVATLANISFHFIITRFFNIGLHFPAGTPDGALAPTMAVTDVILFSIIFATGAGIVYGLVVNVAKRPIRTYLIIAGTVLLLSFLLPLRIPSPPVVMVDKLALVTMHIIGAVAVVGVLVCFGRNK